MIVSDLEYLSNQVPMTPNMEIAFNFLKRTDLANLPNGRIVIDDEKVYAIISEYVTKPLGEIVELEGHEKYIDIQFLVSGHEIIATTSVKAIQDKGVYNEDNDFWNGNLPIEQLTCVRLSAGQAAILYPSDAHAPQAADGTPTLVKKIVVKVALL